MKGEERIDVGVENKKLQYVDSDSKRQQNARQLIKEVFVNVRKRRKLFLTTMVGRNLSLIENKDAPESAADPQI